MTFTRRRLLVGAGLMTFAAAFPDILFAQDVVNGVAEPGPMPDHVLGKSDASVTIIEYASMTCPHCATFHTQTLPQLKSAYLDQGKARYILREFPLDNPAMAGAMLARCAAGDDKRLADANAPAPQDAGGKFHAMVNVLFAQQQVWAGGQNVEEGLLRIARQAGFSQDMFYACLKNGALRKAVRDQAERGQTKFEVRSTPTLFVNGKRMPRGAAINFDGVSKMIDAELTGKS